jgi:proline dehydrogenase
MVRFEDTKTAYKLKTDQELRKAYLLFRLFSKQLLVRFGGKIILFLLRLRVPINGILKNTFYQQFCAGATENDLIELVDLLADLNVKSYMHYAAEGQRTEKGMDASLIHVLETLSHSTTNSALPFAVFKATAFGSTHLFIKKSAKIQLDKEESAAWARVLDRIRRCCEYAKIKGIRLLVDAEESWLQKVIDEIVLNLIRQYNRGEQAFIFNTVQMYRKDRYSYLENLIQIAQKEKFQLGIKLVRGAYMERENLRAIEKGYPSPICPSKQATNANFNAALKLILENLNRCELFLGSHSEESASKVVKWMEDQKMPPNHPKIWFSQLYGMADHISFNLAAKGYQVIKYLPYVPIKEVIPYLIRRAEENTSIGGQSPRELSLIKNELKRRGKAKFQKQK